MCTTTIIKLWKLKFKNNLYLLQNMKILWACRSIEGVCNISFLCTQAYILTKVPLIGGSVSSALCNLIFGILIAWDCRLFCKYKTCSSHIVVYGVCKKVTDMNPSDTASWFWQLIRLNCPRPERKYVGYEVFKHIIIIGKCNQTYWY
jgi:hypothetical protein